MYVNSNVPQPLPYYNILERVHPCITSASLLFISGVAFSMDVFWMKAQASSVFSALI